MLATLACQALPPIEYRGDHVDIGTFFSAPVCAGTVVEIDELARKTAELLELPEDTPRVEIYWGREGIDANCASPVDHPAGCYSRQEDKIFGSWQSLGHELGHALGIRVGYTQIMFEEGLASAFTRNISDPSFERPPSILLGISVDEFFARGGEYLLSAHFVRWLFEVHGIDPLLEIRRRVRRDATAEDVRVEFERAFGVTFEDAEARWAREAPESYDPIFDDPLVPEPWNGGQLEITRTLDCESTTTLGPLTQFVGSDVDEQEGMYAVAAMDSPTPGRYRLALDGVAGDRVMLTQLGCWDHAEDNVGLRLELDAGDDDEFVLSGCRWEVVFITDTADHARPITLRATRIDE